MVMMRLAWNLLEDVGYIDGWGAFEAKWRLMGTSKTRFQATKREGIYHRLTLTEESAAIEGQGL